MNEANDLSVELHAFCESRRTAGKRYAVSDSKKSKKLKPHHGISSRVY